MNLRVLYTLSEHSKSGLRYGLFATAAMLMAYQIYSVHLHEDSRHVWQYQFSTKHIILFSLSLMLVPVNWFLESLKWRLLMQPFIKIYPGEAFRTVLAGLALGIVTPSRIGEYAGRILLTPMLKSREVISSTFASSLAQNITHITVGILLAFVSLNELLSHLFISPFFFFIGMCLQCAVMMALYFYFSKATYFLGNLNIPDKLKRLFLKTSDIYPEDFRLLLKIWLISALRYSVYFIQYLLILSYLEIDVKSWEVVSHLAGIFLIQTLIPLPAFLSIPARGEVAVLVWQNVGIHAVHALTATYTIWLINLVIPAIAGLLILIKSMKTLSKNEKNIVYQNHPFS